MPIPSRRLRGSQPAACLGADTHALLHCQSTMQTRLRLPYLGPTRTYLHYMGDPLAMFSLLLGTRCETRLQPGATANWQHCKRSLWCQWGVYQADPPNLDTGPWPTPHLLMHERQGRLRARGV